MIRLSVHFVTACSSWRIASHETTHTLHFSSGVAMDSGGLCRRIGSLYAMSAAAPPCSSSSASGGSTSGSRAAGRPRAALICLPAAPL